MVILKILFAVWLVNVTTFCMFRARNSNYGATIIPLKEDPHSNIVNYVIAGMLNQADTAFYAFMNDLEGNVVAVNFLASGWRPAAMNTAIRSDIEARTNRTEISEVRIWAISVGDQVARYLAVAPPFQIRTRTVAINPCTTQQCLKPDLQNMGMVAKVLRGVCEYGLGWVSLVPCLNMSGTDTKAPNRGWKYTPMLLADQLVAITNGVPLTFTQYRADFVVLSTQDQFLDNTAIREVFAAVPEEQILTIETDHSGTAVYEAQYREAIRLAEAYLNSTPF